MRLFIAIPFDNAMRSHIMSMQDSLRRQGMRGNFTNPENLHLTLAFIGDYPEPDDVLEAMGSVPFTPILLSLDGYGCFGDLWWAGLKKSDELSAIVKNLRHALADAGIPFDRKKFIPHITLVRRASSIIRPSLQVPDASMVVNRIVLFRSDRGKNSMIYTELGSIS